MSKLDPCVACIKTDAQTITTSGYDGVHQDCPRCGEFKIVRTALSMMNGSIGEDQRAKLSGWIRDQNRAGTIPEITSDIYKKIVTRPLPSVEDRAMRLLIEAAHGQSELGVRFNLTEPRFLAATYSSHKNDLFFLERLLAQRGLIENMSSGGIADISPHGYIALDDILRHPTASLQGFVAMWFDSDLDKAYTEGFQKGIIDAGYNPVRIDRVEHINRIDDEIIAQINASRFVVADFTGHRGGVYFEAGYALGMNLPIFWTCRKDHLDELHFDIRQFNCIDWEAPEELAARLSKRIEAVLGLGENK
ncbi:MAG: hypothetical protein ACFFFH_18595 [Candidatus Thorarchaeota archaeon]